MKKRALLLLLSLCSLSAFGGITPGDFYGIWKHTEPSPDDLVGFTEYKPNGQCLQVDHMVQYGKSRWVFIEGKWGYGKALWLEVIRCSWPGLKPGTRMEVSLVEVTKDHMISLEGGKRIEEVRSEMPIEFRKQLDAYLAQKDGQ